MTSVKELEPAGTLPPGVRGAQRGELLLSIDELALAAPWASGACGVRIKWWGEPGDGTVLLPSQPGCAPQTPTGYAISCGPEQLARYLADMRVLVLDVLDLAAPAPHALGHAYLHLSEAHFGAPLCETLAVYTEAEEELAQLRVSLLVRFAPGAGASLNSSVELPSRLPHRLSSRPLSGSVRDSFVLNEKRAMFDASHKLPMLGRESPAPFESPGGTLQPLEEALPPVASGRETPVDGMMAVEAPEPVSPFSAAVAAADAAAAAADATAAIADAAAAAVAAADAVAAARRAPPKEEARQAPPHGVAAAAADRRRATSGVVGADGGGDAVVGGRADAVAAGPRRHAAQGPRDAARAEGKRRSDAAPPRPLVRRPRPRPPPPRLDARRPRRPPEAAPARADDRRRRRRRGGVGVRGGGDGARLRSHRRRAGRVC